MRENEFAELSGMFRTIVFLAEFEPKKPLHNAKFGAANHLFSEVADPPNTRRKFLTALRKLLTQFLSNPHPQGLLNNAQSCHGLSQDEQHCVDNFLHCGQCRNTSHKDAHPACTVDCSQSLTELKKAGPLVTSSSVFPQNCRVHLHILEASSARGS